MMNIFKPVWFSHMRASFFNLPCILFNKQSAKGERMGLEIMKKSVDSILWQDYRAADTGMIVHYVSDPVSEIPIREIPEEIDSPVIPEPNYENRVYGFFGCIRPKIRSAFFKSKIRYIFFLTKYAGCKDEFKDKPIITGYFRIFKTADVQKLHLRYLNDVACLDADSCIALRADEVHFVSLNNAYIVDDEKLKAWGYNAKINKQLRIVLDADKTNQLLNYLKSKPNQLDIYIAETKRLGPHVEEEEEEKVESDENAHSVTPGVAADIAPDNTYSIAPEVVSDVAADIAPDNAEPGVAPDVGFNDNSSEQHEGLSA